MREVQSKENFPLYIKERVLDQGRCETVSVYRTMGSLCVLLVFGSPEFLNMLFETFFLIISVAIEF